MSRTEAALSTAALYAAAAGLAWLLDRYPRATLTGIYVAATYAGFRSQPSFRAVRKNWHDPV